MAGEYLRNGNLNGIIYRNYERIERVFFVTKIVRINK